MGILFLVQDWFSTENENGKNWKPQKIEFQFPEHALKNETNEEKRGRERDTAIVSLSEQRALEKPAEPWKNPLTFKR